MVLRLEKMTLSESQTHGPFGPAPNAAGEKMGGILRTARKYLGDFRPANFVRTNLTHDQYLTPPPPVGLLSGVPGPPWPRWMRTMRYARAMDSTHCWMRVSMSTMVLSSVCGPGGGAGGVCAGQIDAGHIGERVDARQMWGSGPPCAQREGRGCLP